MTSGRCFRILCDVWFDNGRASILQCASYPAVTVVGVSVEFVWIIGRFDEEMDLAGWLRGLGKHENRQHYASESYFVSTGTHGPMSTSCKIVNEKVADLRSLCSVRHTLHLFVNTQILGVSRLKTPEEGHYQY